MILPAPAAPAVPAAIRTPVVTVIQHNPEVHLDRFAGWLGDVEIDLVRAWDGDAVPTEPTSDGLLVLGGFMSARDDAIAPWLPATRALLAAAVAAEVPVLGLCLGAQLLAASCGGRIQVAAPPGREAGVIDVRWRPEAATDRVLAALAASGRSAAAPTMHADAIVDLPRGAVWLGSSAMYPYQAFRLGSALGLQFHPEAGPDMLREWADSCDDVDTGALLAQYAAREAEISATGQAVAEGFAAAVRQSVTRSSASMMV